MTDETKKGIFSKLFGSKQSCCCNVKIEEVAEDQPEEVKDDQPQISDSEKRDGRGSRCCG